MLTAEGCQTRRARLWQSLPESLELLVVADPQYLAALANFYASPFVFRSVNASALLLLERSGTATLIVDRGLAGFATEAHVDRVVAEAWYDGRHTAPPRKPRLVEIALEHVPSPSLGHVGLESATVPCGFVDGLRARFPKLRVTLIDHELHELKRRKLADEMVLMRASIAAGEAGMAAARARVVPGMSEYDVFWLVHEAAQRQLGIPAPIYGDFVSGPRCEKVGGPPSDRRIEPGDLLLLDFSVVVRGYRGDFATTFRCGMDPTAEQLRIAAACREALATGAALLRPGRPAREIDAAVRAALAQHGLDQHFKSHSGHGLGLGHPDPPYLVPESEDVLVEGDVVALEPGVYIPGVAGMRFEHNFLITAGGCEQLSSHSLDLRQS